MKSGHCTHTVRVAPIVGVREATGHTDAPRTPLVSLSARPIIIIVNQRKLITVLIGLSHQRVDSLLVQINEV